MRITRCICLVAILSLAGCDLVTPRNPAPPAQPAGPPPSTDAGPETDAAPSPPVKTATPRSKIQRKHKPPIETAALIGMTEDDARRVIGEPTDVRDQPPALVWVYASAECELHMYFYAELSSNTFRALTYDVTPTPKHRPTDGSCLESVRASTE
jgi:hypothetical protein